MKVHCDSCGFDGNIWRGLVPPEGRETACPLCGAPIFIPGTGGGDAAADVGGAESLPPSADELAWPSDEGRRDEPHLPLFDGLPVSAEIRVSTRADEGAVLETADAIAQVIVDHETYGFVNPTGTGAIAETEPGEGEKPGDDGTAPGRPGWLQALSERALLLKRSFSSMIRRTVTMRSLFLAATAIGILCFSIGYVVKLAGGKMDTQALSEEYRERADVEDEEMDYIRAAEYYAVSLHIDPTNYKSLNNMASMYLQLHRYDDAIALLDESISIIETDDVAVSYANRGLAYMGLGEYDRALEDLNTAVTIAPDLSYAYTARGFCYLAMEELEKALFEFQTACDMGDRNGCLLYDEHLADRDE